jgi:hypothetical protein
VVWKDRVFDLIFASGGFAGISDSRRKTPALKRAGLGTRKAKTFAATPAATRPRFRLARPISHEKFKETFMQLPENAHLWALFAAGHGLHVLKRASLSTDSKISGTRSRLDWLRTNALALAIRFFVNAAAFSYWLAQPGAATHAMGGMGLPVDLTLEPGHATAGLFGLSGDSMIDWAAAKVPFLQKEIPAVQ